MAAIDPTAAPETDGQGNLPSIPRSTLKIYKANVDDEDEDEDYLESLLGGGDDDDESDEDDEEANGGPSDPSKSKKARRDAAIKKLLAATQEDSDDEMEDAKPNGTKSKGKAKASEDEEESEEEEEDDSELNMEEYVVCTLDTERVSLHLSTFRAINSTRLTCVPDLPTTHRHHRRRGREDLFQRQGHSHCLPHRKLRRSPGRGRGG